MLEALTRETFKWDHSTVQSFFDNSVSTLSQFTHLHSQDVAAARECVKNLEANRYFSELLQASENDYIRQLAIRYSETTILRNMFRLSMIRLLPQTQLILNHWSQELLQKSRLYFNRPMGIYVGKNCETHTLISCILVDVASEFTTIQIQLKTLQQTFCRYLPNSLAVPTKDDRNCDQALASALEFTALEDKTLVEHLEEKFVGYLAQSLIDLANLIDSACRQLAKNFGDSSLHTNPLVEWIRTEGRKLHVMKFADEPQPIHWVHLRLTVNQSFLGTNKALTQMRQEFGHQLRFSNLPGNLNSRPESHRRRVTMKLIQDGLGVKTAELAGHCLATYCKTKQIAPDEMIFEELVLVHPQLTKKSIESFQQAGQEDLTGRGNAMLKSNLLEKSERLANLLKKCLILSVYLLVCACGIKTNPISTTKEFRPGLPVRNHRAAQIPKVGKSKKPPANKEKNHGSTTSHHRPADSLHR